MKEKVKGNHDGAVVVIYRVECNHGNKFFADDDKASAYFDYMTACGFDAELWLVRYIYDERGELVRGDQMLLESAKDQNFISLM